MDLGGNPPREWTWGGTYLITLVAMEMEVDGGASPGLLSWDPGDLEEAMGLGFGSGGEGGTGEGGVKEG